MATVESTDWIDYWNELPSGRLLFAPESEEYVRNLTATRQIDAQTRVLDFGCGYGAIAERLAKRGATVFLWDAAKAMRDSAVARLSHLPIVRVWDSCDSQSFDLILVNSVVQYMTAEELHTWLTRWRPLLAAGGWLVLSDLIPTRHSTLSDILSLFTFSVRRGYLLRAMRGIWRERRRYNSVARHHELHHVDRTALESEAAKTGYRVTFLPRNLTHFTRRTTAVLEAA